MIIRGRPATATSANASQRSPEGTTFAPAWQSATSRPPSSSAVKRPRPRRATSSRKTRSIGSSPQNARTWSRGGSARSSMRASCTTRLGFAPVPIHVRAEPGEYTEACLLPGDPLRAKYIAETYFDNPVQRNSERGMLGYSGEYQGRPVSVQATGMGCPSAAIVMEELVQLGVKRLLRVGTCGGLQRDLST